MKICAIIPAAGQGTRMNNAVPKQFLKLAGQPILYHTLNAFENSGLVDSVVLVVPPGQVESMRQEWANLFPVIQHVIAGGEQRQDSVYNGLRELNRETQIVVVHDGVRPFIETRMLQETVTTAQEYGAAVTAIPLSDTLKLVDGNGFVQTTVNRKGLWRIQTPQAFRYSLLCQAMEKAQTEGFYGTDEGSLIEHFGQTVKLVPGSERNIKITKPEDIPLAELFMTSPKKD